jgi:hypothetical protein
MVETTRTFKDQINDEMDRVSDSLELEDRTDNMYHGDQLPEDVKITIAERGQPEQWENNMKKVGGKVQGYMRNRNTEVKVKERKRADKQKAEVLQELMRHIANHSEYQSEKADSELELQNRGRAVQRKFHKEVLRLCFHLCVLGHICFRLSSLHCFGLCLLNLHQKTYKGLSVGCSLMSGCSFRQSSLFRLRSYQELSRP